MKQLKNNQKAFTVIELLIASTVFSVIILGACVAIIQMTRLYYKGIIMQQTQTAARNLTQSIVQGIQYEGGDINTADITSGKLKIGPSYYTFALNKQQNGSDADAINHVIWKSNSGFGTDLNISAPTANGKDMLANNMRITDLDVGEVDSTNAPGLYKVNITVAYGDSDLIDYGATPITCKGNNAGSQWCAIVSYKTFAYRRN